jgi:hypothetical protein
MTKKIRVIRTRPNASEQTEIVVDWEKIKKHRADDLVLEAYDIVEVSVTGVHADPILGRILSFEPQYPVRKAN